MNKKQNGSRTPWNKGLVAGQKRAFMMDEIAQIEAWLLEQENWHDLALLSFGLDTMFWAGDLLGTRVWQVAYPNCTIRTLIARRQRKTRHIVNPVLTPQTRIYLAHWLKVSLKRPEDFVFTRTKGTQKSSISRSHYADIIKAWAAWLGHEPSEFSSHSIRRSKPAHMYWEGEDIALISRLLGHKSIAATIEYLGITQAKAESAALGHPMMRGFGAKQPKCYRRYCLQLAKNPPLALVSDWSKWLGVKRFSVNQICLNGRVCYIIRPY